MKRWIHAAEDVSDPGFLFEFGNKAIFLKSTQSNLTEKIIRKFVNKVCDIKVVGDKIRQSALYDKATLADFRRRISKANLSHIVTDKVDYYRISGNGFGLNFPAEDFAEQVIVMED